MDLGLQGKVCVVAGGSRGIGLACAATLAAEGAQVIVVGRDRARLERAAGDVARHAADAERAVLPLACDLTAPDAPARIAQAVAETGAGAPWGVVVAAGATRARQLDELPDEVWEEQWRLHVIAPLRLLRSVCPAMAEEGGGRVVVVGSSAGRRPSATLDPSYSVTKAAQHALARTFADRYAARGVNVNVIAPGPVEGELWAGPGGLAEEIARRQRTSVDAVLEATRRRSPTGRMTSADEVAALCALLLSPRVTNATGAVYALDGGAVAAF